MKNRAMTLTLSGLAGLSLWTSLALAQGVDQGIPLLCRPPEAGETANAYIPISQDAAVGAQARMIRTPQTTNRTAHTSNMQTAPLSASPMPLVQSGAAARSSTSVSSVARQGQNANTMIAPLEREVQDGHNYRVCPPPIMPSELPSTQLYAVPSAVAASWECYGPREMAYTPRPWRGPDPAVHSPLPIKPVRATRAPTAPKIKSSPATSEPAHSTPASSAAKLEIGPMPAPSVVSPATGSVPSSELQRGASSANGKTASTGNGVSEQQYRPAVMGGQGSVAAPLIMPSSPSNGQNGRQSTPTAGVQTGQQPYSGAAANVSPSRDIVDPGDSGGRVAQGPTSLLNAPPLTPNLTPSPSGFDPH